MDALLARRKLLKGKITRLRKLMDDAAASDWDIDEATMFDDQINEVWGEFNTLFEEIFSLCPTAEEDAHQIQFDEIATRFDEMKVTVKRIIRQLQRSQTQVPDNRRNSREFRQNEVTVKLPKFDIPTFSGNMLEWTIFCDLFTSSVHKNTSLSDAQRLQYLKSLMKGEAEQLLASYQISDANYKEAWETLTKRYQNVRELIRTHLVRLVDLPTMKMESATELRNLVDTASSVVRALKALNRPINDDSDLAMFLIASRIDSDTNKLWETRIGRNHLPKLSELLEFLDERAAILNSSEFGKVKMASQPKHVTGMSGSNNKKAAVHQTSGNGSCPICPTETHLIYACKKFNEMSIADRKEAVKQHSLCFNCLRGNHFTQKCPSKSTCRECKKRHHSLLHVDQTYTINSGSAHTAIHDGEAERALLSTALVTVTDKFGRNQLYRALIDPGADINIVTERCVQELGIQKQDTELNLSGLGANSVGIAKKMVQLVVGSRFDADQNIGIDAYVLARVTGILPRTPCNANETSHLKNLQLADPSFNTPGRIDILLGSRVFFNSIRPGHINVSEDLPGALKTMFGWIVGGACPSQNFQAASVNHIRCETKLTEILERFWTTEEIPAKTILTKEEKECEDHFVASTTRDVNGRFIVELPFRKDAAPLGASRDAAVKRLKSMERSLQYKPELKVQYVDFMKEYEALGHMELVPCDAMQKPHNEVCYLAHHAVIKESSTTTKVRVVFDASSKTSTGRSLNDVLLTGPKLQDDLFTILVRFRMYIVAYTADICKMFRQIWVANKHQDFQRIVWRESPDQPIRDYRLTTVTYGTSSAPYLSKRCLQLLAEQGRGEFPEASPVAARDYYMDDLMSGHFSVQHALEVQDQMLKLLDSAGLELRKWSSNSEMLLHPLRPDQCETQLPLRIDEDDMIKTLGLYWLPAVDKFWFKVKTPPMRKIVSKRTICSDAAKIFDPLGILAPVTIIPKIIMQQLWCIELEWDSQVPDNIELQWNEYCKLLFELEQIKIDRCIKPYDKSHYELIGFSDASEKAMAAVVYARSTDENGVYVVNLVAAKSKVAPLKQLSLPRLELNGAVMLVRLMQAVSGSFITAPQSMMAFTDSTVVLAWLAKHPKRWDTFVANRVSQIQDFLPFEHWFHVSGTENPADCASRGITPTELIKHALWWHGPEWLKTPLYQPGKPEGDILATREMAYTEARREAVLHHVTHDLSLLQKFSSLTKLQRVTGYCYRFIANCRAGRKNKNVQFLSSQELKFAMLYWIRLVQESSFHSELTSCLQKKSVKANSRLRCLNPFVDDSGILRVGGRLGRAKISMERRNPILLPTSHVLTNLIIMHEHFNLLHGGTQLVLTSLQKHFWILNGRNTVRHAIHNCIRCARFRKANHTQLMGDLPTARVNPDRAFRKVGVDFAGPYLLRVHKSRGNKNYKSYIAVFVCMVTRAIHLELVTSLSSEAFISTLKRFIARRSLPSDIFSDCGRNFVGADKELRRLWKSHEMQNNVGEFLASNSIRWHFNAPASPHFGGLWEAGIKSMKYHLNRAVGVSVFNYEDMYTVLTQVEACLNSRPLTQLSTDPNDMSALTPGHFLVGDAMTAIPEDNLSDEITSHLCKWKQMQRAVQIFWKRWSMEYLCRLQQRPKWMFKQPSLQMGDLVLLRDERLPPLKWKLARIVETHPGADGLVRVFTIKTSDGTLKRPLSKLCPLPIDANN